MNHDDFILDHQSKRRRVTTTNPNSTNHSVVSSPLLSPASTTMTSTLSSVGPFNALELNLNKKVSILGTRLLIDGYTDVSVDAMLYDHTVGCRAKSTCRGDLPVWIKLSITAESNAAEQFEAEEAILMYMRRRGLTFVSNVYAREYDEVYGDKLIIEDDGFQTLGERYLSMPRVFGQPHWSNVDELVEAIAMAIKIVQRLAQIHALSIVHNSLNPTIISISRTAEIHIHDFSLALYAARHSDVAPGRERGMSNESLHYLAPEATRRIANPQADYRSDYYSLGALLYEIFTGSTPFADCEDTLEILHAAIARKPAPASSLDSSIPESISLLLAKLLEKHPSQRYQTSQGLIVDLERIQRLLRNHQTYSPTLFKIGSIDGAAHFQLPPPSRMFGRATPIRSLQEAYMRVEKSGEGEVVVIKGSSGIGKSILVDTVNHRDRRGSYTTTVKFDQIKSPVPSFAILSSLSGLLRQCMSETASSLEAWRGRLTKAMRNEARILAEALPVLVTVFPPGWIDTLPEVTKLEPEQSEARFQDLVRRVLTCFARKGKTLVITFDDLQWCLASDITFILSLISKSFASTLIICVYRDNEVTVDHPLCTSLLPQLPKSHTIALVPLSLLEIKEFCSEALRNPVLTEWEIEDIKKLNDGTLHERDLVDDDDSELTKLSEAIMRKTKGSPLFVAQLLKSLNAENIFTFDFQSRRWIADLSGINSMSSQSTSDVLDLLINQIRQLSPPAQALLKIAACLGNEELDAETFAAAAGTTLETLSEELREVLDAGLLLAGLGEEKTTETSLSASPIPSRLYTFFHDRCQQAAYSLIPENQQSMLRYTIGSRLIAATPESALADNIFHLVGQLNHGIVDFSVLTTSTERERLASLNYLAALKANRSYAFEAARSYLIIAKDLLGAGGWESQYELMNNLVEALVEVEYSLVQYKSALDYVQLYLSHAKEEAIVDKLRIYMRAVKCAAGIGAIAEAIAFGIQGLAVAGVHLPNDANEAAALAKSINIDLKMTIPEIQALINLPTDPDPIIVGALELMASMTASVYFTRMELLPALGALSARATIQNGICAAGAFGLIVFAVCLQDGTSEAMRASYEIGKVAITYFRAGTKSTLSCQSFKVFGSHIEPWAVPLRETEASFKTAILYSVEYRDAEYSSYGCAELASYNLLGGRNLCEVLIDLERYTILVRRYLHEIGTQYIAMILQAVYNFTGRAQDPLILNGDAFTPADYDIMYGKGYALSIHLHAMLRIMLATFFHDKVAAKDAMECGRAYLYGALGSVYPVFYQLFETISFYDHFDTLTAAETETLNSNIAYFDRLSVANPHQFEPMRLWVHAEEARAQGDSLAAIARYDIAIAASTQSGMIHLSACMNERCAMTIASPKFAIGYILEAYDLWRQWGCLAKTKHLEAIYPNLIFSRTSSTSSATQTITHSSHHTMQNSLYPLDEDISETKTSVSAGSESEMNMSANHAMSSGTRSRGGRGHGDWEPIRSHQLAASLDLRAVVTAAAVLSSESDVDGIVSKLLFLALRTAGAERCLLVLDEASVLTPKAMVSADSSEVVLFRSDISPPDFPSALLNYVARSHSVVNGSWDTSTVLDSYLDQRRPKSMLCIALSFLSRTVGVLYCEHSQVSGAFTADRLEILSLIASQAASTIERARLVEDLRSANSNLEAKVAERTSELESAKDLAETATLNKSHFLAFTSHEVRTPMNSILALSSLLFDTKLTPLQSDYVETIKNSSHELLVVINDILDVSKIENDRMELVNGVVSMRDILETSLDYVAERASTKSIELAMFLDHDCNIIGDLVRIRQIIVNLLSNAVKFTPAKGEVVLDCKCSQLTDQSISICISVRDNGIGMVDEDLKKLFQVFSQVGVETARQFGGSGLGLAISRRLAVLMAGEISVQSQLGLGSTFTLNFCAPASAPSMETLAITQHNLDFVGKRILLVDGTVSRTETGRLLASFGFSVDTAIDAMSASSLLLSDSSFDVIVIDALLPDSSDLIHRVRQAGMKATLPIIELTRLGLGSQQENLEATDRLLTLAKPVKKHRLFATIRQIFPAPIEAGSLGVVSNLATASLFPPGFAAEYPLRILCAEDNPINRKVIVSVLNRLGYHSIDLAHDGEEAVTMAMKGVYDLLITDIMMPKVTGLQAAQELVKNMPDKTLRPTIVALTASATIDERNRCFEHGCDGFLAKPLLIPDLVELLQSVSRNRGTAKSSEAISSPDTSTIASLSPNLSTFDLRQ